MCGFIGYVLNHDTKREKQIEEKFNFYLKQLNNRGPDYSESKKIIHNDKIINFGFARLAIQDLSNNANKIFFNDKYILLFNGEIYNHNELRSKYFVNEKFETKTDTEVLFKLLTNYDFKKITELKGIFSIVFIKLGENKILQALNRYTICKIEKDSSFHQRHGFHIALVKKELIPKV